jgi:hypothetical protein
VAAVSYKGYYSLEIGDANGDVAVMRIPTQVVDDTTTVGAYAANLAAIGTALGAPGTITNGKVIRQSFSFTKMEAQLAGGSPPLDAEFPSVADKASLTFTNSNGSKITVSVPAPIEALFHAPPADDTVDPASAIAALITSIESSASDVGNHALNLYQGGVRRKSRARRRKQHRL